MATEFHSFEALREALADADFDRPPAFVANAHITGLSVARALDAHDVPVIALDRNGDGVAPGSEAIEFAGEVTYPLDDQEGFRADVEALAAELDHDPVAFGCMDEWVHAFAATEPAGVRLPFADRDVVDAVLDKSSLYRTAEDLGIPYPETYRLDEVDPDEAADELGFPLVVKPALKREFEEAIGTNVIEVADRDEYHDVVEMAREADIRVMAQKKVPVARGEDCSYVSYVRQDGDALGLVGNPAIRYPLGYGTSCLVQLVDRPEVEDAARAVLDDTGYYGISEAEFVFDQDREAYVLLDVNTRPWKWIGLPVAAGANLPMAAYADIVDEATYTSQGPTDTTWVYLRDYLSVLADSPTFPDALTPDDWRALVSGDFENPAADSPAITTGVYSPRDPDPTIQLIETEFGGTEYYCSC